MSKLPSHIFMDHHSTTPVDRRVVDRMMPFFTEVFGNPSSRHRDGELAGKAVETAREQVGALINAPAKAISFTSGATESINLALLGAADFYKAQRPHFITAVTEHPAVLETCHALEQDGVRITYLQVNPQGMVDPKAVEQAINRETALISIMYTNNEIGTVQNVQAIGEAARNHNILYHCDASQAVGLEPIDVEEMGIDMLSLTAHKFYGPKGTGALFLRHRRPRVRIKPVLFGGGHENGIRPGTLNVPGIVGLGAACEFAKAEREERVAHMKNLRDRMYDQFRKRIREVRLNGHPIRRHPGNLSLTFLGVDARALLEKLPHISLSSGSACSSAVPQSSHVLLALGLSDRMARGTVRFGVGRSTTEAEVDSVVDQVCEALDELRSSG